MSEYWWVWVSAGLGLAILEIFAPGYIFIGFAIGAISVGIGLALGLWGGSLPILLVIFALLSLLAWWLLRRFMGVRRGQVKIWTRDINE